MLESSVCSLEGSWRFVRPSSHRESVHVAFFAVVVSCRIFSKAWAMENLRVAPMPRTLGVCERDEVGRMEPGRRQTEPQVIIPGFFELRYAENCGAAFGIMREWPKPLFPFSSWWLLARSRSARSSFVVRGAFLRRRRALILGGAIGNFVDRVRLGFVAFHPLTATCLSRCARASRSH